MWYDWGLLLRQPYASWIVEGRLRVYFARFPPPKEVEGKRIVILAGPLDPEHEGEEWPTKKAIGTVLVRKIIRGVSLDDLRKGKVPDVKREDIKSYPMRFIKDAKRVDVVIFAEPERWEPPREYRRDKPTINWAKGVEVL